MPEENPLEQQERAQDRITERWLLDVDKFYAKYLAEMDELMEASSGGIPSIPSGKSYLPTDSTGRMAAQLCEKHRYYTRWFELVRDAEQVLPYHKRLLLLLRREARTNKARHEGWCPQLQRQYNIAIARARGGKYREHDRHYFSRTWKQIVHTAVRMGLKRGLFDEEE